MKYISVSETAKKWNISERSVRNYCTESRVAGAILEGKTWLIPENATKPVRKKKTSEKGRTLLDVLKTEKESATKGGIYHKLQIELTYNSNHIEGSRLTHDQTRMIFETNTVGMDNTAMPVDDIIETANHFRCIDYIIDVTGKAITEQMIKNLHAMLKGGTSDSRKAWFAVGDYKKLPNEVGGRVTAKPEEVAKEIKSLLADYNANKTKTLEDIIEFHYRFEIIHPFQDGNGRVGRLLLLKECLKHNIVPFVIDEEHKMFYYRGLTEWKSERGYLLETCLSAQDRFKKWLDYFKIEYKD